MVRQTADVLRRFGALEENDYVKAQAAGRDGNLIRCRGPLVSRRRGAAARGGGNARRPGDRARRR
jgi:hypothetical protein